MGIFAITSRRNPADGPEARKELPERVRARLPHRFEAVGEVLASGAGSLDAFEVAGRSLAEDGAALEEALGALRTTALVVVGREPRYAEVHALSVAWSEATLAYLHQLSCEDPLTGLASLAHVRARLSELFRAHGPRVRESHALVVMDLPADRPGVGRADPFARTLRLTRLGESARTVFPGGETVGRVGSNRMVAVVERDQRLGRRVALLRRLLGDTEHPTRVWIEGLPATDAGASYLLDELARP